DVLGPDFCKNVALAALGFSTNLSDLFSKAAAGTPDPGWDFEPDELQVKKGTTVLVTDQGGEPHTFTEVKQFGGGFIDGLNHEEVFMKKYIIEREIPKIGDLNREQLRNASAKSNQVLDQLGNDIQWSESFVTADKLYCIYLANDEAIIRKHAELSGFPASKITEIGNIIDPTTGA